MWVVLTDQPSTTAVLPDLETVFAFLRRVKECKLSYSDIRICLEGKVVAITERGQLNDFPRQLGEAVQAFNHSMQ